MVANGACSVVRVVSLALALALATGLAIVTVVPIVSTAAFSASAICQGHIGGLDLATLGVR